MKELLTEVAEVLAEQNWRGDLQERLRDAAAIAPPVAAGSVDTMQRYEEGGEFVKYTDAIEWGAQQRELGKQEALDLAVSVGQLRQRAEKAEAELKRVNEWREAALASNHEMQELIYARSDAAEARIKELEAALAKAYPNAIDPSNTPC